MNSDIDVRFLLHKDRIFKLLKLPLVTQISDVKSILCKDCDIEEEECEIIFCGNIMKDDKTLCEYNLSSQTTLHVVSRPKSKSDEISSRKEFCINRNSYLTGIWLHRQRTYFPFVLSNPDTNEGDLCSKHPQFHVYCKNGCLQVKPGKLRVRCNNCKEDSIILHSEPKEWNDVLKIGNIYGSCCSKKCGNSVCDAEFYFKCSVCQGHLSQPINVESAIPLTNVISNMKDASCLTCLEICNPVVTFPCDDEHIMCLNCFEEYSRTRLRERQMELCKNVGYSVNCPLGCEGSYMADVHLFHILGIDEYRTYQAFAAEECLIREMKGMICPNPECGTGLFPDLAHDFKTNTKITCAHCGHEFCSSCRESYHGTSNCNARLVSPLGNSVTVRDYLASMKTIQEISKNCPNCKVSTERSGGCMHMTCKMCSFEWCWNCLTRWNYECQANHWFN